MTDWLDTIVEKWNSDLRAECTSKRIDWNKESPVHGSWAEWKECVGPETRGIWHTLTENQKFAIAQDALEQAKELYENR